MPSVRLGAWLLATSLLGAGCAASRPQLRATGAAQPAPHTEAVAAFQELNALLAAADVRMLRRSALTPSVAQQFLVLQQSLRHEEAAGVLDGSADPLTFEPRRYALQRAAERLDALAPEARQQPAARQARAIWREEHARWLREQRPGQAQVELAHGLAFAFFAPAPRDGAASPATSSPADREALLSRRLGELEDDSSALDQLDAAALGDALDRIEPELDPGGTAGRALASLRLALATPHPPAQGPRTAPPWAGSQGDAATRARWHALREQLSQSLHAPLAPRETLQRDAAQEWVADALLRDASCAVQLPVAPPPERAIGCHALAQSEGDPTRLALLAHDLLTLGLWSLALGEQRDDARRVLRDDTLAAQASPELAGRWMRLAASVPAWTLRAGQLGAHLAEAPSAERAQRARTYLEQGALLPSELDDPRPLTPP